jgi:hypothetical protein
MDDDERALLSGVLLEAARQMLAAGKRWEVVGCELSQVDLVDTFVVSIGLGSPAGLRGKLVIIARPEFFRSTYPRDISAGEVSNPALADWASEVANQLLGRIKNRLSAHAVNFALGTPAVIGGDRLRILCRDRPGSLVRSVRIDGRRMDLMLEMERSDGGRILGSDGERVPTAAEGTSLLF